MPELQRTRETWTQTYTGRRFDILNPRSEDINVVDIIAGLAKICRFKGQTSQHYSVAQHSVHVMNLVMKHTKDKRVLWAALMHDAHEAYTGDFPAPWKNLIRIDGRDVTEVCSRIDNEIAIALIGCDIWKEIDELHLDLIHRADLAMVYQEKQQLLPVSDLSWGPFWDGFKLEKDEHVRIVPMHWAVAENVFKEALSILDKASILSSHFGNRILGDQ